MYILVLPGLWVQFVWDWLAFLQLYLLINFCHSYMLKHRIFRYARCSGLVEVAKKVLTKFCRARLCRVQSLTPQASHVSKMVSFARGFVLKLKFELNMVLTVFLHFCNKLFRKMAPHHWLIRDILIKVKIKPLSATHLVLEISSFPRIQRCLILKVLILILT